jgi:GntR family transcriptional regulator/MocR family aminotransferase
MLLELDGRGPRYAQLTRAIVHAVSTGTLRPGARLPSTRRLARDLACSRNIVLLAYEQLSLEGYLSARAKAGTFVSEELPASTSDTHHHRKTTRQRTSALPEHGTQLAEISQRARAITRRVRRYPIDFMYGQCEPDARIVGQLRRGFARALRDRSAFGYGHPAGDEALRAEVAQRLRGTRGIARTADQIVITSGAQQALDLCARLLLRAGDRALVEDPGYEAARAAFECAGAEVVPVRVDDDGIDPSALPRNARRARLVYVTPSHQFPTGAILSAARRHRLRAWARERDVYVIEDDYDGELRYHGQPIKALAGLDANDPGVIYCGTFAKSLFPAMRLGYLALPDSLAGAFVSAKWLSDRGSSPLLQRLVRDLMASGEYDRHIRRMVRRYAARRDALTRALERHLGSQVRIGGDGSGLHLVAWFPSLGPRGIDRLVAACADLDVGVYSIARHAIRPMASAGLILGYGLVEEVDIEAGASRLAAAYSAICVPHRAASALHSPSS